jgi:hypothetical protein
MDHDQRLKTLLKEFFPEFFLLFFPTWAARFDFAKIEWLDKEVFTDPPQGDRLYLDLVARLPTLEHIPGQAGAEPWLALVHVEVESGDAVAALRPRMFEYYCVLRRRHRLPVLPIGLYLQVGLEGLGIDRYEEVFGELKPIRFEYLYVGLPALPSATYLDGPNALGVALTALMNTPAEERVQLKAEALRRIMEMEDNAWRRFLLGDFVGAYLPLEGSQEVEFERLVSEPPYEEVKMVTKSWYDQGVEKGREALVEEMRDAFQAALEERFGPLSETTLERLQTMTLEQVKQAIKALGRPVSLKDLGLED